MTDSLGRDSQKPVIYTMKGKKAGRQKSQGKSIFNRREKKNEGKEEKSMSVQEMKTRALPDPLWTRERLRRVKKSYRHSDPYYMQ